MRYGASPPLSTIPKRKELQLILGAAPDHLFTPRMSRTPLWHDMLLSMPTILDRTSVTHTPRVRQALNVASKRWPGERESVLLAKLVERGAQSVEDELQAQRDARVAAIRRGAGSLDGVFGASYLKDIREGWNE